jgi:hypothetical protein
VRTTRFIAALGGAVLLLVLLAASPAGGAARRSIAAFARNAGAVNGIKASRTPRPGRLVPLGRNAKLPSSVVPTVRGARGLRGSQGPIGLAGPQGPQGAPGPVGPAGPGASKVGFDAPANTPTATILSFGGLILRAACSAAGDITVGARSTLDNARLHVAAVADTGAFYREDDDLDAGSDYDLLGSDDDDVGGTIVYRTATGTGAVSISFLGEEYSIAGVARCQFAGTAVSAQ